MSLPEFILENMKHTEKKKAIKNIGRALRWEIFILKVTKSGNYMKTEKVVHIFIILAVILREIAIFCGIVSQIMQQNA